MNLIQPSTKLAQKNSLILYSIESEADQEGALYQGTTSVVPHRVYV